MTAKEEIKLSLYSENMTDYVENPKKLTKKTLLELISDCGKFAGCRVKFVNIQIVHQ